MNETISAPHSPHRDELARARVRQQRPAMALLMIDLINPFDFPTGASLFRRALPAARAAGALQARAREAGVPVIYVNDQFRSDARNLDELVAHSRRSGGHAAALLDVLPIDSRQDHFVAKRYHSGFFGTALERTLRALHVDRLILTGVAADICVLATAFDAHMRHFELTVPRDCVASETEDAESWAVRQMARVFDADVRASEHLELPAARAVEDHSRRDTR